MYGLTIDEQPLLDSKHTQGRFAGQVVVVTGGGGGIGGCIVHRFLSDGAGVAILDMDETRVGEKLSEMEPNLANNARFYPIDVSLREDCFRVVERVEEEMGPVRHLVNCVAYFGSKSLEAKKEDWQRTFEVNVMGNAFMSQACIKFMQTRVGVNQSIVHVSSCSAHQAQPNRWTYGASKGAINILTKDMALDVAKYKIRVNSVSPAWIWSPEVCKAAEWSREKWEPIWGPFHMLKRMGEMSEVAASVVFLCSQDAAFINATDLKVDGGYGAMSAEGLGENSSFAGSSN